MVKKQKIIMVNDRSFKWCKDCDLVKPIEQFSTKNISKSCLKCISERSKKAYHDNKERYYKYVKQKNRVNIVEA